MQGGTRGIPRWAFLLEYDIRLVGSLIFRDLVDLPRRGSVEPRIVGTVVPGVPRCMKHGYPFLLDKGQQAL